MPKPVINLTGQNDGALELRFTNYVKLAFVKAVREAFANAYTSPEYRYSTDPKQSQIAIYRGFPKRGPVKYPCIIVETDSGNVSISTLDREQAYEVYDENDIVTDLMYSGTMNIRVNMSVIADTTTDREKITDLLAIYTRFVFRDLFLKYNMPYLDIQAGDDGEETIDDRVFYKGKVVVSLQTEFMQKIDMSLYDAVMAINLEDVRYGSDTTDLQKNTVP